MSEFYGYDGQERLSRDAEDVVRDLMEDAEYSNFPIKVHVFESQEPFKNSEKFANSILEDILENLDENYGDPDSNGTEPTENMKKASLELTKVLTKEYHVWMCEPTGKILEFSEDEVRKIANL